MSSKLLPIGLVASLAVLSPGLVVPPASAGTCASNCAPSAIRFTPGQAIRVQVLNRTSSVVHFEQIGEIDPYPLLPGQELELAVGEGTEPNVSIRFSDAIGLSLKAAITQPEDNVLRVEFHPGGSDRAIYVMDDGRVMVY